MSSLPSFSLKDKIVVVTGAGRGIGRQITLDAHKSGASIAVGSRTSSEIDSLAEQISSDGGDCFSYPLDVTRVDSIQEFFQAVSKRFPRIDILVNNAGYNEQRSALDYDEETYDTIVDTNLKSVFFCCQAAATRMTETKTQGAIVNISSQAGVRGAPARAPYSGAKAGVNNLTRTLAAEWAEHGIRVNAVAPTVTRSKMTEQAMRDNPSFANTVKARNLLRRGMAEPAEISAPVIFLASDAASMVTGHILVVDGGWTIS